MGAHLPKLGLERFGRRLRAATAEPVEDEAVNALFAHYEELRSWNPRLSLIGPGTTDDAVERHYAESLAGRELLRSSDRRLVDLGSGAGFPGLPLAAAVPSLEVWLVEPRNRKWAFLRSSAAVAGLSCHCLDARIDRALPADFPDRVDVLTVRALKMEPEGWAAVAGCLKRGGRLLRWGSSEPPEEMDGWKVGRQLRLPGRDRWVLELKPGR